MAGNYKTPGVYFQEPNSLPNAIVGVNTAVPAFIGYTQMATDIDGRDLHLVPRKISSIAEFNTVFGGGYVERYYLSSATPTTLIDRDRGTVSLDGNTSYHLIEVGGAGFNLYNSMRLFYANGGRACYVCSCGRYETNGMPNTPSATDMTDALAAVGAITGPTMLAIPDAVRLDTLADFSSVAAATLQQCQVEGDRMALLDVPSPGAVAPHGSFDDIIANFRAGLAGAREEALRYGAAYFPSLVTSIVQPGDLDMTSFDLSDAHKTTLVGALTATVQANYPALPVGSTPTAALSTKGAAIVSSYIDQIGNSVANDTPPTPAVPQPLTHRALTDALTALVPGFSQLLSAMAASQSVLPPSGALAGVWCTNDADNGVWNAPANIGIAKLIEPSIQISDDQQQDVNAPTNGLSVNAIRTFPGRGNLIWGARTLDGQSSDWRYIEVRRTVIYIEQSVKSALQDQVFKPNNAATWNIVVSMIETFLHGLWTAGGLMGSAPSEAYAVLCGMGSTMTPDDVRNGVMRVQIMVQMVRLAEFITLTFKQQMITGA